jgi:hypothetical protein
MTKIGDVAIYIATGPRDRRTPGASNNYKVVTEMSDLMNIGS